MHGIFGAKHLILVGVCIVAIVGLFLLARKQRFSTVSKTLFYIGIVSETIKILYYIVRNEAKYGGILPKSDLPFQLCSIQIIFIAIINFSKSDKLKRFLLAFMAPSCLFGGAAAILIATNSALNGMWIISLQYFAYHAAIIVYSLCIYTSKEIKLNIGDYFNCLKFLGVLAFFAIYINSMMYDGVSEFNFMYVVSPPQEGLPFLNENDGWLAYICRYALLVIVCVTLGYIKPIIDAVKAKLAARKAKASKSPDETQNSTD